MHFFRSVLRTLLDGLAIALRLVHGTDERYLDGSVMASTEARDSEWCCKNPKKKANEASEYPGAYTYDCQHMSVPWLICYEPETRPISEFVCRHVRESVSLI